MCHIIFSSEIELINLSKRQAGKRKMREVAEPSRLYSNSFTQHERRV